MFHSTIRYTSLPLIATLVLVLSTSLVSYSWFGSFLPTSTSRSSQTQTSCTSFIIRL